MTPPIPTWSVSSGSISPPSPPFHTNTNTNDTNNNEEDAREEEADYVVQDSLQKPSNNAETEQMPPHQTKKRSHLYQYSMDSRTGRILTKLSTLLKYMTSKKKNGGEEDEEEEEGVEMRFAGSALAGFLSLLLVTCANYVLGPMRDAAALAVGVQHIPKLTLVSTGLAIVSSVPIGWLFEAPDPDRQRLVWRKMGLTRGDTQGTSLALFYRIFSLLLLSYALGFPLLDHYTTTLSSSTSSTTIADPIAIPIRMVASAAAAAVDDETCMTTWGGLWQVVRNVMSNLNSMVPQSVVFSNHLRTFFYVAFFLVIHLMKLHSISLIWGVTSEAMEYEEQAELRAQKKKQQQQNNQTQTQNQPPQDTTDEDNNPAHRHAAHNTQHASNKPVLSSIPSGRLVSSDGMLSSSAALYPSNNNNDHSKPHPPPPTPQHPHATISGSGSSSAQTTSTSTSTKSEDKKGSKSRARLKRLAFVGFGGTLGGILGSIIASVAAHLLHMSGLLVVAAIMLEASAELSIELGRIMQRHWEEEQRLLQLAEQNNDYHTNNNANHNNTMVVNFEEADISMKRVASTNSMKRVASGNSLNMRRNGISLSDLANNANATSSRSSSSGGGMHPSESAQSLSSVDNNWGHDETDTRTRTRSESFSTPFTMNQQQQQQQQHQQQQQPTPVMVVPDDNSFSQRLLRGVTTILRSRLLMAIFTYNALYASTSVLLSFQRAELVANRIQTDAASGMNTSQSAESDTSFLAKINMASSVAVFCMQASGLGAYMAHKCGQRGTLALMPLIRLGGVLLLAWWHIKGDGQPPNLTLFLMLDELTRVINFAVAKPVRESLWHGLSNEARYEAKPIVDTLANRWGGGSAAFSVSLLDKLMDVTHIGGGETMEDGTRKLFGLPPVLLLCMVVAAWWAMVSADLGHIRSRIDAELKKQQ
eukprot:scaffold18721_cov48-Attheya_sp.AAC.1